MKKEEYELILTNLQDRLNNCHKHLDNILSTEDLELLNVKELVELSDFCKAEQSAMDKIIKIELYHIIGMGKLSAVQMGKFIAKITEYLSFRSDIKTIACNLESIRKLPGIPSANTYKLSILGNFTLTSISRGNGKPIVVESENCDELFDLMKEKTLAKLGYMIKPDCVLLKKDMLDKSFKVFNKLFKVVALNTFRSKLVTNKEYLGFKWTTEDNFYKGEFVSEAVHNTLLKYTKQEVME